MTRPITRDGHSAVHGLAMRAGCSCPDCGSCGPRRLTAFEEDVPHADGFDDFDDLGQDGFDDDAFLAALFDEGDGDYAARRRRQPARRAPARPARPPARSRLPAMTGPARTPPRRGGAPRKPLPRHRQLTPRQQSATRRLLGALGWTGWRQGVGGGAVSVQDLVNFSAAGGVRQRPGAADPSRPSDQSRLMLTPQGRRMLRQDPRFRKLAPMFNAAGQRLYHIAEPGAHPAHRSHYVGTTGQSTGLRVLEHLRYPNRDRVHPELVRAARAGRLDQLQVQQGRVTGAASQVSMTHGAEVLLQNLQRSDWNDPRKHGFDDEALGFDW